MATNDLDILLERCRAMTNGGKEYSSADAYIVGAIIAKLAEAQGTVAEDEQAFLNCASFLVLRAFKEHGIAATPDECSRLARSIYVIGKAAGRRAKQRTGRNATV